LGETRTGKNWKQTGPPPVSSRSKNWGAFLHASALAREALERIAALYAIDDEIRGRPPEERQQVRQTRTRPLLQSLHDWFEVSLTKLSRKSDTTAPLCADAVAGTDPLLRRRSLGGRQQCCRTCFACSHAGLKELSFRRLRCGRRAGCRHL